MSAFPGDQVDEKPLAEDLQVLRAQGEMSKEEETAMNLRDQINRDILSQKKKEGGGGTKKTKKLSSKLSSSKAKTRELFEESRRETFMELNVPPSNHPSSMFPEPVVLEESSSSHRRTSRSGNKPRSKGRADPIITMKEEEDHSPLKQSHEDITEKLEAEHAKTVRKEKETEKETVRRRRREAREVAQPPEEAASSSPSSSGEATRAGDDPLLARLDPPAEHTDIDKALMAKEEGNDFFRSKNYDFACQQYAQAVKLCPREGTEGVGRGTGTHTTSGSGDDDSNKPQPCISRPAQPNWNRTLHWKGANTYTVQLVPFTIKSHRPLSPKLSKHLNLLTRTSSSITKTHPQCFIFDIIPSYA